MRSALPEQSFEGMLLTSSLKRLVNDLAAESPSQHLLSSKRLLRLPLARSWTSKQFPAFRSPQSGCESSDFG
jgi:hypothetical protein